MEVCYAGYPSVFVFDAPGSKKKVQHLLWGDWIRIDERNDEWLKIHSRGCDGWVRKR
jgi:hypothetical protein